MIRVYRIMKNPIINSDSDVYVGKKIYMIKFSRINKIVITAFIFRKRLLLFLSIFLRIGFCSSSYPSTEAATMVI